MSSVTRPRGPLPPRVYWTRRLLVVVVALGLVFAFARLFGGSDSGGGASARPVDSSVRSSSGTPTTSDPSGPEQMVGPTPTITSSDGPSTGSSTGPTTASTPLPAPQGRCADDDVHVDPAVKGTAYAGSAVVLALSLTTTSSPACTWTISPGSLVVKITSGADRIWSTQDCRGAILKQDVVVRKDTTTVVDLAWNARRSDPGCTSSSGWVKPGYYHAVAAAWGAEPVDTQFRLHSVVPETTTAYPKPRHRHTASASPSATPSGSATPSRSASPSASASPQARQSTKRARAHHRHAHRG